MLAAGFYFLLGVLAGGVLVWVLSQRGRAQRQAELEAQLERALPRVAEAVLGPKTAQWERAAEQELKLLGNETVAQVTNSQAGMQKTLEAMGQRLESYQKQIGEFEQARAAAAARVQDQVTAVAAAGAAMTREARTLREALATSSGVRGAWGEAVLQNILNACGLNPSIDYDLQVAVEGDTRLRPDAVIYLPAGRKLIVDAKASLAAFLEGLEAPDEPRRRGCYEKFAQVLRTRAKELAGKEYSRHLAGSLPCVVMFVPSEGAFRAALDADFGLIEYGQGLSTPVVLASPSTLFPLIAVVAQGWQQEKASQQVQQLIEEVTEFGRRLQPFLKHMQAVGSGLESANKAYNAALASYRSRVEPRWQRLQELNAGWDDAPALKPVETRPLLADAAGTDE